jgi:osmotically-inducible protein OsmY
MLTASVVERTTPLSGAEASASENPQVTLAMRVQSALARSGYAELRSLQVLVIDAGSVRLEGSVSTYFLKQMGQHCALSQPGVGNVDDQIEVR